MKAIAIKKIAVNLATGRVLEDRAKLKLFQPSLDCQVCGIEHDEKMPHILASLYYQYAFMAHQGRYPTWADACAHCDPKVRAGYRAALAGSGTLWTEPPEGIRPVADFGFGE